METTKDEIRIIDTSLSIFEGDLQNAIDSLTRIKDELKEPYISAEIEIDITISGGGDGWGYDKDIEVILYGVRPKTKKEIDADLFRQLQYEQQQKDNAERAKRAQEQIERETLKKLKEKYEK